MAAPAKVSVHPSRHVYDVIVLGGQLAGAVAAALLAKHGNRVLLVQGEAIGPIETFGRPFLMAEQTHPNADGQRVIATGVADEIEKTDVFRRFLGTGG